MFSFSTALSIDQAIFSYSYNFFRGRRVIVTGGNGFLGKRLTRHLRIAGSDLVAPSRAECDLANPDDVDEFMRQVSGDNPSDTILFHLAATVSGINYTRKHPVRHLVENTQIANNVLDSAAQHEIGYVVAAGSVCAYPEYVPMPMRESNLWHGKPEPTNAAYGQAKRYLLSLLEAYIEEGRLRGGAYLISANLYGPGDRFDPIKSHVIPSLIIKAKAAKQSGEPLYVWGDGKSTRDFLHVDDAARAYMLAAHHLIENPNGIENANRIVCNIGSGVETSIAELACTIAELYGVEKIVFDSSMPSGQSRRLMDVSLAKYLISWRPMKDLRLGLQETIDYYEEISQ